MCLLKYPSRKTDSSCSQYLILRDKRIEDDSNLVRRPLYWVGRWQILAMLLNCAYNTEFPQLVNEYSIINPALDTPNLQQTLSQQTLTPYYISTRIRIIPLLAS